MVVIVVSKKGMSGLYFGVYTENKKEVFAEDRTFDAFAEPF
jgi:hypothetical protein